MMKSANGTRMIGGREYLLAGRQVAFFADEYAACKQQAKSLERNWFDVKVRRANGFDVTFWVHGAR